MAADRTLMAWIRTTLSMISFGFTIYKFLQYMVEEGAVKRLQPEGPRNLGLALVSLGTLALIFASIQHWKFVRGLPAIGERKRTWDLALTMASLLAVLGALVVGNIIFSVGPF